MRLWREHLTKVVMAVIVAVVSITSAAIAAWEAWTVHPLPPAATPYEWGGAATATLTAAARPANLDDVLDADPFRFGEQRDITSDATATAEAVVQQECRLIGTVVGLDGESFAMCDVGGVSRLVRQGQKVGAWTLLRVERAQVVFRDKDGEPITLKVAQPGGAAR